jgi:hypothetical protein
MVMNSANNNKNEQPHLDSLNTKQDHTIHLYDVWNPGRGFGQV